MCVCVYVCVFGTLIVRVSLPLPALAGVLLVLVYFRPRRHVRAYALLGKTVVITDMTPFPPLVPLVCAVICGCFLVDHDTTSPPMNLMFSLLFRPRRSPRSPLATADGIEVPDGVDIVVSSCIAEQTAARSSQSDVF